MNLFTSKKHCQRPDIWEWSLESLSATENVGSPHISSVFVGRIDKVFNPSKTNSNILLQSNADHGTDETTACVQELISALWMATCRICENINLYFLYKYNFSAIVPGQKSSPYITRVAVHLPTTWSQHRHPSTDPPLMLLIHQELTVE